MGNLAGLNLTADDPEGELIWGVDFDAYRTLWTKRQLIVTPLGYALAPAAGLALVGHLLAALQPAPGRPDVALLPGRWLPVDADSFAAQGCRGPSPG